mgnify:CR=1 FL=1
MLIAEIYSNIFNLCFRGPCRENFQTHHIKRHMFPNHSPIYSSAVLSLSCFILIFYNFNLNYTLFQIWERLRSATCTSTSMCTILTRARTRFFYSICWDFHNLLNKRVTFAISVWIHLIHKHVLNTCKWI